VTTASSLFAAADGAGVLVLCRRLLRPSAQRDAPEKRISGRGKGVVVVPGGSRAVETPSALPPPQLPMRPLLLALPLYIVGVALVLHLRPSCMFRDDGAWKEFGTDGSPARTATPFYLFALAWGLLSYALSVAAVGAAASAAFASSSAGADSVGGGSISGPVDFGDITTPVSKVLRMR
jgi:hypothetical protein